MKLRTLITYLFCIAASAFFATAAAAERRVALVIGNSAYKNAPTLANTTNDANAIAKLLKSANFEVVISHNDLGVVDFKRTVREFLITAENSDIAVVYYAGHGIETGGTNYLIPVDAKLSRDYDIDDEGVALDRLIWALQSVRRLRLIILDACRDNPFAARVRSAGLRSAVRGGLGALDDVGADTLVAFAAKAGSVSYDGDGPNSPFATALLRHLTEPGVDIRISLGEVRDDVVTMTSGRQEPYIYGSLGGATIPLVPAAAPRAEPPPPPQVSRPVPPISVAPPPPPPVPVAPPRAAAPPPAPAAPPVAVARPAPAPPAAVPSPSPTVIARTNPNPQPTPVAREAVDPALACARDEQRLAQLRADPTPEQVAKFQKELTCPRLEAQVKRLLESVSADPQQPAVAAPPREAQVQPPVAAAPNCASEETRLSNLRADPNAEEIRKFERELSCEHIRPQLQRLRESLGL
jgi:Caspase domain